jgi:hypothetical protein
MTFTICTFTYHNLGNQIKKVSRAHAQQTQKIRPILVRRTHMKRQLATSRYKGKENIQLDLIVKR